MRRRHDEPLSARAPEPGVFVAPLAQRLGSAAALAVLAPLALLMAVLTLWVGPQSLPLALALALATAVVAALAGHVACDAFAKWRLRIELGPRRVRLRLPRWRSHVHRPPPFVESLGYDEIDAVETRLEAYRTLGLAAMQRAYALRLRDGRHVLLGEDRGLGSAVAQVGLGGLAQELALHAEVDLTDLGMVQGGGGLALLAWASPPPWGARGLDAQQRRQLWRRVALTALAPGVAFVLAWLVTALAR